MGGVLLRTPLEAGDVALDSTPGDSRSDPVLMKGLDDYRVVESASLDVHLVRMPRRRCEDGGAAFWAEMPRQLVATVRTLGERFRIPAGDAEFCETEADTNVERATSASTTVLAVTVACRADRTAVLINDVSA